MKINSVKTTKHTINRRRKRFKRKLLSKSKKLAKNRLNSGFLNKLDNERIVQIISPQHISFERKAHNKTIAFFSKIKKLTVQKRKRIFISFKDVKYMESTATLMLIAEIERIQYLTNSSYIKGCLPTEDIPAQVFCKTGLSRLLGINTKVDINHKTVTYWNNYLTGTDATVINAAKELEKINLKPKYRSAFFNGISEAITNACMHAYKNTKTKKEIPERADGYPFSDHKWWMFTGCNEERLTLVICDLGQGIPESLKNRNDFSFIKKVISKLDGGKESKVIKTSMEVGSSSSDLAHRGKGMAQLKEAIDIMQDGSLSILSNKGLYTYSASKKEKFSTDLKHSIMGTIISWSAPLDKLQKMIEDEQENNQH
ncbi:hypothetical protein [Thiomicrorhabdus arctica]|uniref:hypothetical protein n=1 Tax=Thiomicrorhabdus arctica TaxID=131540 RepID=UPI00036F67C2|nr:hypothetical protein [Thiomicrorhabdus arctica]